jgi:prepilin signal peptidase PulO-like enzyme (type II secretory pathway)
MPLEIILYLAVFLLGLIIGSFLNMVIVRLAGSPSWGHKRSVCPSCEKVISWYDNIPVLSFIILKAKCRNCHKKISWQYPIVEIICALLFVLWYFLFGTSLKTISLMIFSAFLIVIFVYDLRHYLILDIVTIPAMIFALLINWLINGISLASLLIAGIFGAGFFAVQYFGSYAIDWYQKHKIKDKSEIQTWVGDGDIRLGGLMGLMLGWPQLLVALFLSYIIGALVGVSLIAFGKKQMSSMLPFGPFLVFSTFVSLAFGDFLVKWYLGLLGL